MAKLAWTYASRRWKDRQSISQYQKIFCRGILVLLLAWLTGCNRQDTEALARIGHKIAVHARTNADEMSSKLDLPWKSSRREPSLQEKIQERLRWENVLTDITLEVQVKEKVVELKGTVKTAQQRQRAIELAETVAGVEKVTDTVQIHENK